MFGWKLNSPPANLERTMVHLSKTLTHFPSIATLKKHMSCKAALLEQSFVRNSVLPLQMVRPFLALPSSMALPTDEKVTKRAAKHSIYTLIPAPACLHSAPVGLSVPTHGAQSCMKLVLSSILPTRSERKREEQKRSTYLLPFSHYFCPNHFSSFAAITLRKRESHKNTAWKHANTNLILNESDYASFIE